MARKVLVTGAAGFIAFHLIESLRRLGDSIVGIDNINDYYSIDLKFARLEQAGISRTEVDWQKVVQSTTTGNYRFIRMSLEDKPAIMELCRQENFDYIVNLGAQAGVRYSIDNPDQYIQANVVGFFNVLEAARQFNVKHLVYASSSSIYGNSKVIPFSVNQQVDEPISLYAATKKSNELMAHTYSHLFGLQTTGLRFFTVYGPWGRPDMAYFLFSDAISQGRPIKVFNNGDMKRDFTYIDDIVQGIVNVIGKNDYSAGDSATGSPCYRILNFGNNRPVRLLDFIREVEKNIGKPANMEFLPMQEGDVMNTWADIEEAVRVVNYKPSTDLAEGIAHFVKWYRWWTGTSKG